MKATFIKTTDKDTKDTLIKLGYNLVDQSNGFYVFVNDRPILFDNDVKKNVIFSDRITI